MNTNNFNTHCESNSQSLSAQARFLMSQNRQKQQHRQQSMLLRVASEVGINA